MTDGDDWRVTISLAGQAQVGQAQRALSEHYVRELAGQLSREAPPGAVVRIEEPGVGRPFIPS